VPPEDRDFVERLEHLTWVVARGLLVGVPVFMLVLFAFLGLYDTVGPLVPLVLATATAIGATISVERLLGRRRGAGRAVTAEGRLRAPVRPYRPVLLAGLAVAGVYVVFILIASGRA
jgi:hypothetical protein